MKKIIVLFCIILFAIPVLNGQVVKHSFRTSEGLIEVEKLANHEVVFLFDDFKSGVVYYPNQRLAQMRLNYRLMADEFIVEDRSGRHRSLSTGARFDSILVHNKVFIYLDGQGYFEKLSSGDVFFLVKHSSTYTIQEVRSDSYGQASSSAAMQESHILQIRGRSDMSNHSGEIRHENSTGNPMMVSVERKPTFGVLVDDKFVQIANRRQLLRQFPEHRSQLRRFMADENIDLVNTADLSRLVDYLSTLD